MKPNISIYSLTFILLLTTFLLMSPFTMMGQLTVQGIDFYGLKKTKTNYLQRFIDTELDAPVDEKILEADLQRLKNLNSIADGVIEIDTNQQIVNFRLKEALTLFPIINFGGVRGNFWYQLGFTDDNWAGKGQKLTVFYQNNDGRNNFSLFYKIPNFGRSRWGGSLSFLRWASIEPLFFDDATVYYDYDNLSLGLSSFYEINRENNVEFGLTYFVENYKKNSRHEGTITPGPTELEQPKILAKLIHYRTTINYHFFYLSNYDNTASLQTVYNFYDNTWFYIFLNDTRWFRRIGDKGNLAARLRIGIATNNNTPFAPFVLDSYVNIRGSGNRIERGTGALILNLEYRHTIFDKPAFASQVVAFSDAGSWRHPGGALEDLVNGNTLQHFVGGGIRFIYKLAFDAIFRIDYGVDITDKSRRGFVIGIGQYF